MQTPVVFGLSSLASDDQRELKVIAATQWALPQVDIYVGLLESFASSLHIVQASSRSIATGRRVYRHSKPNAGDAFGVADAGDEENDHFGTRFEPQVSVETSDFCEIYAIFGRCMDVL